MNFLNRLFHKPKEELQVEMDMQGRKLPYAFRPSPKSGKPLLVVLHGNGNNKIPSKFISPDYNVLLPLDQYGIKNNGCWFLGENGDFFVLRMLKTLIAKIRALEKTGSELYFWGSSMGGYAALLLSLILNAQAAFCHIPQVNLYNSAWYLKNQAFIDLIFGDDNKSHPWRDLANLVAARDAALPLFFLSFNRFDRPGYLEQQLWPLLKVLDQKNANYFLQIHPQQGHANHQSVAQHVANFKIYAREIKANSEKTAMPAK